MENLLGGTAQRALLHRDQPLPTQDEIAHHQRLWLAARHYLAEMRRPDQGARLRAPGAPMFFMIDEPLPGFRSWTASWQSSRSRRYRIKSPATTWGLYSSGTPAGPKHQARERKEPIDLPNPLLKIHCADMCGMNSDSIYLSRRRCTTPLLALQHDGDHARGTSVIMESFDAEEFLKLVREATRSPSRSWCDHVRAHAETSGRSAPALRRSSLKGRDPCRSACPVDVKAKMSSGGGRS